MALSNKGGRGEARFPRPLLDRFLQAGGGAWMDADECLAAIRRDVETLLNTRSPADEPSVVGYGLPDFTHMSPDSADDMWRLAARIRETLERFETRLERVRVEVGEGGVLLVTAETRAGLGRMEFIVRRMIWRRA